MSYFYCCHNVTVVKWSSSVWLTVWSLCHLLHLFCSHFSSVAIFGFWRVHRGPVGPVELLPGEFRLGGGESIHGPSCCVKVSVGSSFSPLLLWQKSPTVTFFRVLNTERRRHDIRQGFTCLTDILELQWLSTDHFHIGFCWEWCFCHRKNGATPWRISCERHHCVAWAALNTQDAHTYNEKLVCSGSHFSSVVESRS